MPVKVLGSVQPAYLAWIPFFQRMRESDVFVYLDDVKYSKNSFHNRNRISTAQGPIYLTVPVRYSGNSTATIQTIQIDNSIPWARKHWRSIVQNYAKAPFFSELAPRLEEDIYARSWTFLGELNVALAELFRKYLAIDTPCFQSSRLNAGGDGNEKLVNLCRELGADTFIVKPGTEHYHPREYFEARGVAFKYFTPAEMLYPQLHGNSVAGLSILDYAMNCGPGSLAKEAT
jgi:hypothetical protein